MEDEVTAGLIAIAGTIIGGLTTLVTQLLLARKEAKRELEATAFRCLVRLEKIRLASGQKGEKTRQDEIYHLGQDLDSYMAAAATRPRRTRSTHFEIQKKILPIVMHHDLTDVENVLTDLKHLRLFGSEPNR